MSQELMNTILSALGVVLTGLASYATTMVVKWLNSKIKDNQLAKWSRELFEIVMSSVKQVMQTYVDSLKKEGKFDKEAQAYAFDKCMEIVENQLSSELKQYIKDNFGEIEPYLKTQIEAIIYSLKN